MIEEKRESLKPLTVAEILDNTFRIYKDNILAILIFSAVIGGFLSLIMSFFAWRSMPTAMLGNGWEDFLQDPNILAEGQANINFEDIWPQMFMFQGVAMLLSLISGIFINPFIQGGITNVAYHDIKGQRLDYKKGIRSTLKQYWSIVLTGLSLIPYYIVVAIAIMIVIFILLIPLIFLGVGLSTDPTGGQIAGFIVFLLLFILSIVVMSILGGLFVLFTYPVAMGEKTYHFAAIGRSFKLVTKKFWRVVGINFLIRLIIGIIGGILVFITWITSIMAPGSLVVNFTLSFLMTAFIAPIGYIATTLLYTDIRARTEGPSIIE